VSVGEEHEEEDVVSEGEVLMSVVRSDNDVLLISVGVELSSSMGVVVVVVVGTEWWLVGSSGAA
jgi:hypothetical protein